MNESVSQAPDKQPRIFTPHEPQLNGDANRHVDIKSRGNKEGPMQSVSPADDQPSPLDPATFTKMVDGKLISEITTNPTTGKTPTIVSPALTPPERQGDLANETQLKSSSPTNSTAQTTSDVKPETFVRQRISIRGVPRPMEPAEEIPILGLPHDQIGIVKEGPVVRWLTGLQIYDKKYKSEAKKSIKMRQHNKSRAQMLLDRARAAGIAIDATDGVRQLEVGNVKRPLDVLDLADERPPPSAICGRLDTVCFS